MINRTTKTAMAIALAGALAVTAVTPSFARGGRIAAGIVGFAAGAAIGAAAANANRGYYYGEPYAYNSGYAPAYAYEPGYAYDPAPRYGRSYRSNSADSCAVEGAYRPDYSNC